MNEAGSIVEEIFQQAVQHAAVHGQAAIVVRVSRLLDASGNREVSVDLVEHDQFVVNLPDDEEEVPS